MLGYPHTPDLPLQKSTSAGRHSELDEVARLTLADAGPIPAEAKVAFMPALRARFYLDALKKRDYDIPIEDTGVEEKRDYDIPKNATAVAAEVEKLEAEIEISRTRTKHAEVVHAHGLK